MTKVTHQFRNTKLQLWPVINVAECLTELCHDKIRNCPTESTLCKDIFVKCVINLSVHEVYQSYVFLIYFKNNSCSKSVF